MRRCVAHGLAIGGLIIGLGAAQGPNISEAKPAPVSSVHRKPGFREQVRRGKRVTVHAQNAKGEEFEMTGEDLLARAFLHETDHLYGKLYIMHISVLKRDLLKRKIRKMQRAGEWE